VRCNGSRAQWRLGGEDQASASLAQAIRLFEEVGDQERAAEVSAAVSRARRPGAGPRR
jgi:hypothetical protein